MSVAARPETAGKTRTCPHCKATILESLTICPGCLHHLRFDQEAAKRQVAAESALRVEGVIAHPSTATAPWEYFVVISVRNERGEEVTRQVVNVGALQNAEKRTFTLSVEVMQPQPVVVPNRPGAPANVRVPASTVAQPLGGATSAGASARPGVAPAGAATRPGSALDPGAAPRPPAGASPGPSPKPTQAGVAKAPPGSLPPKR